MLLHAGTRASLGLDVAGSVVVVDEAHNLIDAINGVHAATVTLPQLAAAHAMVRAYLHRYAARMRGPAGDPPPPGPMRSCRATQM
jgi:chromosome transmission fidelity protein 1